MLKHFGETKDRHIYLSTSNQARPDDIKIVRRWLEKKGWIIIEHEGGHYEEQLIYKTSIMLMIGYDTSFTYERTIGRGQYKQLYNRESYDYGSNWMLTGYTIEGEPEFFPVKTDGVLNDTLYKRDYGAFYVDIVNKKSINLQDYNKVGVGTKKPMAKTPKPKASSAAFDEKVDKKKPVVSGHFPDPFDLNNRKDDGKPKIRLASIVIARQL